MADAPVRKFGFLIVGLQKTVSVPAKFASAEAAMAEASQMAICASDKIILIENRTDETRKILQSEGKSAAWLQ